MKYTDYFICMLLFMAHNNHTHDIPQNLLLTEKANAALTNNSSSNQLLLAMDLNGVVLNREMSNIPSFITKIIQKKGIFFLYAIAKAAYNINAERQQLLPNGTIEKRSWGQMLYEHDYPDDPLYEYIQVMKEGAVVANPLNQKMASILTHLIQRHHIVHYISNMGSNILQSIIQARSQELTSDEMKNFFSDTKHSYVAGPDNNWERKPNAHPYHAFLQKNSDSHYNLAIFVDDEKENCKAALLHGFDAAIIYKNPTNFKNIIKIILHA